MLTDHETPRTPDFWLLRLGRKMKARDEKRLTRWRNYLRGEHPLPEHPKQDPQTVEAFRRFQRMSRTNLTRIPVVAATNRLTCTGIKDSEGRSLTEAWRWGKLSRLEAQQNNLYRLALGQSVSYAYVTTMEHDGALVPRFTVEHPRQVITEDDPITGRPVVGLKAWFDDIEHVGYAAVVIPVGQPNAGAYTYKTDQRTSSKLPWGETNWSLVKDPSPAPLSVPFVPFYAQSEVGEEPVSIFDHVIEIQDRINFGIFNRMSTERTMAFPINYVTGHKFETTFDPLTGLEKPTNPFRSEAGNMLASEEENARFGQLPAAQIDGFLKSFESDVMTFFVLTNTPAYYLPGGDMINVSTDTILALDSNHVALVNEMQQSFGESLEEMFRVGAELIESDIDFSYAQTSWKDPRQFSPSVWADYGSKLKAIGYSTPLIAEKMGEDPDTVERVRVEDARQQLLAAAGNAQTGAVSGSNNSSAGVSDGSGQATGQASSSASGNV